MSQTKTVVVIGSPGLRSKSRLSARHVAGGAGRGAFTIEADISSAYALVHGQRTREGAERIHGEVDPIRGPDQGCLYAATSRPLRVPNDDSKETSVKTAFLSILTVLAATAAQAHPGHVAPAGGHSHGEVIALVAIAVVAFAAFFALARRG